MVYYSMIGTCTWGCTWRSSIYWKHGILYFCPTVQWHLNVKNWIRDLFLHNHSCAFVNEFSFSSIKRKNWDAWWLDSAGCGIGFEKDIGFVKSSSFPSAMDFLLTGGFSLILGSSAESLSTLKLEQATRLSCWLFFPQDNIVSFTIYAHFPLKLLGRIQLSFSSHLANFLVLPSCCPFLYKMVLTQFVTLSGVQPLQVLPHSHLATQYL